jgi:hypothetical protein
MAGLERGTAAEVRRQRNTRMVYGAWALLSAALTLGLLLVLRPGVKAEVDPQDLPIETLDIDLGPLVREDKPAVDRRVIVESAAAAEPAAAPAEPARARPAPPPRVVRRRPPARRPPPVRRPPRTAAKPAPAPAPEASPQPPPRRTKPAIGTVGHPAIGTLEEAPAIGRVKE